MPVLSIDLASRDYSDIGVVALTRLEGTAVVAPIDLSSIGLVGRPVAATLASLLVGAQMNSAR